MRYFLSSFIRKVRRHTTLLTMLTLAVVFLSIPLTIMILKGNQDIRQEASERVAVQSEPISVQAWSDRPKSAKVPGKILVRFKATVQSNSVSATNAENRIKKKFRASIARNDKLRVRVVRVKPGQEQQVIDDLSHDPSVDFVQQSSYVYVADTPNDPDFRKQWGLQKVQVPAAWDVTEGKDSVVIAILDTGIDENHPDLKGKILTDKSVNMVKVANGKETVQDKYGHGTHVAGIAAAVTNNNEGVAGGCPNCKLMNVKVMPDSGTNGQDTDVAEGIRYAVDNGANIINMSLSGPDEMQVINEAIDYAVSKGVLVVVAAGNTGSSTPAYPASYDKAIAVGAVDENGNKAAFSNYGKWVDIAAPGTNIVSTFPTYSFGLQKKAGLPKKYGALEGTSMAAPLVSGLAGLMMSQGMSADEVRQKLLSTTDKIRGKAFANGTINAARALGGESSDQPNPSDKPEKQKKDKSGKTPDDTETTPEPCTAPPDQGSKDKSHNSKTPNTNRPDNSKKSSKTKPDKKASGGLAARLIEKANALRAKFFGGGGAGRSNTRQQNTNSKQGAGKNGQENTSNKGGTIRIQSLDTARKDPCNPADSNPSNPDRSSDRTPRPTRAERGSGTPGHQEVIVTPGEQKIEITRTQEIVPPEIIINGTPQDGNVDSSSITIIDYNLIINCYSDVVPPRDCSPDKKSQADLNKDGDVNQLDYNLFLKQIATQK